MYCKCFVILLFWGASVQSGLARRPAIPDASGQRIALKDLDLSKLRQGWGQPQPNKSVEGKTLSVAGKTFTDGLGSHAPSVLHIQLDGKVFRFQGLIGVDDETKGRGTIRCLIYGDKKKIYETALVKGGNALQPIDVDLTNVRHLMLITDATQDGNAYDHVDWIKATFFYGGRPPEAVDPPSMHGPKVFLTPKPGPEPRINGPRLFGVRPGKPFIYRIPCTGTHPMTFRVDDLPANLRVNPDTGIIAGTAPQTPGEYVVRLCAQNTSGSTEKFFTLVVGDTLALTPPMGWNSWYIHYHRVTEGHMRRAADAMIETGMADVGYMYVNIDDCWMKKRGDEPYRDANQAILPNQKFPDIQGMTAYIHQHGLRAGLYTSPGEWTCGGYVGSYQHEEIDARRFAQWGFDFLKYDWCSYGSVYNERMKQSQDDLLEKRRPYQLMGDILTRQDRDIVLNLCQYGMSDVWQWGAAVGGQCWRTTGDLGLAGAGLLPGFYGIGFSNMQHWEYAKPGQWNDPDYILIGWVGSARRTGEGEPTTLTGNEQYSYMSMWCLMAAPLVFSGDMEKLDAFTLNVLCNPEVIDIDQDALGQQAHPLRHTDEELILAKSMEDGSLAVGLFGLGEFDRALSVTWQELGISGSYRVRDVWRHQDIGQFDHTFTASVSRHGVKLIRLWPAE